MPSWQLDTERRENMRRAVVENPCKLFLCGSRVPSPVGAGEKRFGNQREAFPFAVLCDVLASILRLAQLSQLVVFVVQR
ncbi:MAG: hypothetical protein ACRD36_07820, partial [Candidatus Acidiferrum sp.]